MVVSCAAYNCRERFKKGGPYTFHLFPRDENRRKLWEIKLRRKNFTANNHSRICSKHFEDDCFEMVYGQNRLKHDAVPTKFDFSETFFKKDKHKKKKRKMKELDKCSSTSAPESKIQRKDVGSDSVQILKTPPSGLIVVKLSSTAPETSPSTLSPKASFKVKEEIVYQEQCSESTQHFSPTETLLDSLPKSQNSQIILSLSDIIDKSSLSQPSKEQSSQIYTVQPGHSNLSIDERSGTLKCRCVKVVPPIVPEILPTTVSQERNFKLKEENDYQEESLEQTQQPSPAEILPDSSAMPQEQFTLSLPGSLNQPSHSKSLTPKPLQILTDQPEYSNSAKDQRSEALRSFLLSLLPELEAMSDDEVKQFRRKVFLLIDEITN